LDDAIKRYNESIVRNILKSGEEYVANEERGMSVWIARDKNGELYLYKSEPWRCKEDKNGHFDCDADEMLLPMDEDMYPEITWENSPKEFELKAVEK
jgi:frataxin-like iron-binding protein CyaY